MRNLAIRLQTAFCVFKDSTPFAKIVALSLTIVALNLADALFTLHLIKHGATEMNPLMVWALGVGANFFIFFKMTLVCLALFGIVCSARKYTRWVMVALWLLCALFILIVSYQTGYTILIALR